MRSLNEVKPVFFLLKGKDQLPVVSPPKKNTQGSLCFLCTHAEAEWPQRAGIGSVDLS